MLNCEFAKKLQAPFDASDIEWKPQTCGISNDGIAYLLAVPFVTNRAIQKRLDEVFGIFGWENEYKPSSHEKGYLCGISVYDGNGKKITRWDGAEATHIEPLKGGLSNSMKRAAVQLGIGRYLYDLPEFWAVCVATENARKLDGYDNLVRKNKKNRLAKNIAWKNPDLPEWALPTIDFHEYFVQISNADTIPELKQAFANAWKVSKVNQDEEHCHKFKSLYDSRVKAFEKEAAENIAETTAEITAWIEKQADSLDLLPNVEAVSIVYERLKESLNAKCENTFVDKAHLFKQLENIYLNRKNSLEQAA